MNPYQGPPPPQMMGGMPPPPFMMQGQPMMAPPMMNGPGPGPGLGMANTGFIGAPPVMNSAPPNYAAAPTNNSTTTSAAPMSYAAHPSYKPVQPVVMYVSDISTRASSEHVRSLLEVVGEVLNWHRQYDPVNNDPLKTGFCEYDASLDFKMAYRLLNGLELKGKPLKITFDTKLGDVAKLVEEEELTDEIKKRIDFLKAQLAEIIDNGTKSTKKNVASFPEPENPLLQADVMKIEKSAYNEDIWEDIKAFQEYQKKIDNDAIEKRRKHILRLADKLRREQATKRDTTNLFAEVTKEESKEIKPPTPTNAKAAEPFPLPPRDGSTMKRKLDVPELPPKPSEPEVKQPIKQPVAKPSVKKGFLSLGKKSKKLKTTVFETESNGGEDTKERKLVPITYTDAEMNAVKPVSQQLADTLAQINQASSKPGGIDWAKVKSLNLIQSVIKPWVVKSVIEFLGEEEETLISFIINNLEQENDPDALLEELQAVLDEDAIQFVDSLKNLISDKCK